MRTSTRTTGRRDHRHETNATTTATITKNSTSTTGEIQTISFETWMILPHWRQLIRWKVNRPRPSVNPAKIPNQIASDRREMAETIAVETTDCVCDGEAGALDVIRCA